MVLVPSLMVCNVDEGIIFYINPPVHRYIVSWSGIPTCQSVKCQVLGNARKEAEEFVLTECKYRICCYYDVLAQCLTSRRIILTKSVTLRWRSNSSRAQLRNSTFVGELGISSTTDQPYPHPELRRKILTVQSSDNFSPQAENSLSLDELRCHHQRLFSIIITVLQ